MRHRVSLRAMVQSLRAYAAVFAFVSFLGFAFDDAAPKHAAVGFEWPMRRVRSRIEGGFLVEDIPLSGYEAAELIEKNIPAPRMVNGFISSQEKEYRLNVEYCRYFKEFAPVDPITRELRFVDESAFSDIFDSSHPLGEAHTLSYLPTLQKMTDAQEKLKSVKNQGEALVLIKELSELFDLLPPSGQYHYSLSKQTLTLTRFWLSTRKSPIDWVQLADAVLGNRNFFLFGREARKEYLKFLPEAVEMLTRKEASSMNMESLGRLMVDSPDLAKVVLDKAYVKYRHDVSVHMLQWGFRRMHDQNVPKWLDYLDDPETFTYEESLFHQAAKKSSRALIKCILALRNI